MLIDDVKIKIFSGKGGDGRVAFNKIKMNKGPTGGDGGQGGDVYFRGIANIGALSRFRGKKVFRALDGKMGGDQKRSGKNGSDLVLDVPVGTVIHFLERQISKEIIKIDEKIPVARGGRGGKGNFFFRSSRNTTPMTAEKGGKGQQFDLRLELKLIADVGLIGFPNVGKSSLLNMLTNAKSRVANYPFTTLEPNLGAYYELILADIPGLIEGASFGKGLGIKFLRHIERTKIFFHLISAQSEDPVKDYKAIRKELGEYNKNLLKKKEFVFLSKKDMVLEKDWKEKLKALKKINPKVLAISILDDRDMEKVRKILGEIIEKKKV